jgi:hypothetical protein
MRARSLRQGDALQNELANALPRVGLILLPEDLTCTAADET